MCLGWHSVWVELRVTYHLLHHSCPLGQVAGERGHATSSGTLPQVIQESVFNHLDLSQQRVAHVPC